MISIDIAKEILGNNFIGPDELKSIFGSIPFKVDNIPSLDLSMETLLCIKDDFIIILGISNTIDNNKITINRLHSNFGHSSDKNEPCFYNQDWYINENFAEKECLKNKWYIIKKGLKENSCGINPENIILDKNENLPSAILSAYTFFCYYLLNNEILRKNNYIWCSDKDHNGDRIYTGRYIDPEGINKNGFSVHRHLSIRNIYGLAPELII